MSTHVQRRYLFIFFILTVKKCATAAEIELKESIIEAFSPIESTESWTSAVTLRLVQIVQIHGQCYDGLNDSMKIYNDERGLTNEGKWQQFQLGRSFRRRYNQSIYNASRTRARSSDRDCALESAYCLLAGLFPPSQQSTVEHESAWNENLRWQPVPVHTTPRNIDCLLEANSFCGRYHIESHRRSGLESLIYNDTDLEFLEFLAAEVSQMTGTSPKDVVDYIERAMESKVSIPTWVEPALGENGRRIEATFAMDALTHDAYKLTEKLTWFKSGGLLAEVVSNMQGKMDSLNVKIRNRLLYLYTMEPSVAFSLMSLLKLHYMIPIQKSAESGRVGALIIEMHGNFSDNWVQFLYQDNEDSAASAISFRCSLDALVQLVASYKHTASQGITTEDSTSNVSIRLLEPRHEIDNGLLTSAHLHVIFITGSGLLIIIVALILIVAVNHNEIKLKIHFHRYRTMYDEIK